jgi:hypothetical protein
MITGPCLYFRLVPAITWAQNKRNVILAVKVARAGDAPVRVGQSSFEFRLEEDKLCSTQFCLKLSILIKFSGVWSLCLSFTERWWMTLYLRPSMSFLAEFSLMHVMCLSNDRRFWLNWERRRQEVGPAFWSRRQGYWPLLICTEWYIYTN